jgi:hypothetical protein
MAEEDAGVRRWKTCLHEAGHAVAGHRLLKRTVKATVYDDGTGATYYYRQETAPRSFEEALTVAAGPAAGQLAESYAPPQPSPR